MSAFLTGRNFGSNIQTADVADNSITLAKLAHGTANQNIQYNASGAPSDVALALGATSQEKSNIMLNAFRISVNSALVKFNMVDGIVDQYEDESATNDAQLVNEVYDASGDFYTPDDQDDLSSGLGTWSASHTQGGTIGNLGDGVTDSGQWYSPNMSGAYVQLDLGSGNSATPTHIRVVQSNDTGQTTRLIFTGSNDNSSYTTLLDTSSNVTTGDFTHTMSHNSTAWRYFRLTGYKNSNYRFGLYEVTLLGAGAAKNMVIQSDSFTALAVPTKAFITIWHEPLDATTLNTDFTAEVSRDGGSTFTQVTLTKEADLSTGDIISGLVDISGQASGTALEYRLKTFNGKDQKIHAVALEWA